MREHIEAYLLDLDAFFNGGNHWQAGLYRMLEGLTVEQAVWRPSPERHSIWEALRHINFWKYYTISYLRYSKKPDIKSGTWTLAPENATQLDWENELDRTRTLHEELRGTAEDLGDELFDVDEERANYIRQIICHDAYHAGQIGLLRVMQGLPSIEE